MPWDIKPGFGDCGDDQFAVVKRGTSEVEGCHDTRGDAEDQLAALNANVDEAAAEPNLDTPDAGDLNTAARKIAADRNWAMDDGSYPIRPLDNHGKRDLQKAIRAVGRGSGSHNAIRRHIIKRARALGLSDTLPDDWSSDGKQEAAQPAAATLAESRTLGEATRGQPAGQRMRIMLINEGWGASGHYSAKVLKEAARDRVFPAGLHMYLDHPTVTESIERPERSVRDLAATLARDARYDPERRGLVAEADVFGPFQSALAEMADHIGLSIRATGVVEHGEAEGRTGRIVTRLEEAASVDFVTEAGRGGRIVELIESARHLREARNVGQWLEAHIHRMFTEIADGMFGDGRLTREERIALSSAIGDGLAAFVQRVEADAPQVYERDLFDEPEPASAEMSEATTNVPGRQPPPAEPRLKEGQQMSHSQPGAPHGGAPTTGKTPAISEAEKHVEELRTQLAEAQAKLERRSDHAVRLEEAERDNEGLRAENARFRALEDVRSQVAAGLAESGLPEATWPRVTARIVGHEGAGIPLAESGGVDSDKLKAAIEGAVKDKREEIASVLESQGVGVPRGLGGSSDEGPNAEEIDKGLAEAFQSFGMSEKAASAAVTGRG